jgi:hypothetical protein
MKTNLTFIALTMLLICSCEKHNETKNFAIGEGFELYLTVKPYIHNLYLDYSTVNFDTILLEDAPFLRYNDVLKYDTLSHKLTLGVNHDSLKIGEAGVYGRMFVATIDRKPIYCGFKWPVYSSVPCNWVFIEEPYQSLDHLNDNEIVISIRSGAANDPRLDRRIVNRLKADGKIR